MSDDAAEARQEAEDKRLYEANRSRQRGCIIKMIVGWLILGAIIITVMIVIRTVVIRDQTQIQEHLDTIVETDFPEGFYPYSMNRFLGIKLISFWHREHVREDGRTTSVVAIYSEKEWQNHTVEEVEEVALENMEKRLERNEFVVLERAKKTVDRDGEQVSVWVFSGNTWINEDRFPATTCYRFMQGPDGPLQIHSIGLNKNFPESMQLQAVSSVKVLAPKAD